MNKEQVEGKFDQAKGKIKREYGKAVDDPSTELSGAKDQAKGKAKEAFGDAKDAVKKEQERQKRPA